MKKIFVLLLLYMNQYLLCEVNKSAQLVGNDNIVYISPSNNSKFHRITTNIIIRAKNKLNETTITPQVLTVTGSSSGIHTGKFTLSDDERTMLYYPDFPFNWGETVYVELNNGVRDRVGNLIGSLVFNFDIYPDGNLEVNQNSKKNINQIIKRINPNIGKQSSKSNNVNLPLSQNPYPFYLPWDFPQFSIKTSNPCSGYLFISNMPSDNGGDYSADFLLILDSLGNPFFYQRLESVGYDWKLQPNGKITYFDGYGRMYFGMDTTFTVVDSFYCKNGYNTNEHDLNILPNGHILITGEDDYIIDMSKLVQDGQTNVSVMGAVIQELDNKQNVVFQWRSQDHFDILDATSDIGLTGQLIDFPHTNSVDVDVDSNIIISSRHADEITKIDRETGDIIWRLGGKHNEFKFINDTVGFSHQHDVRVIEKGIITMMDNGNLHSDILPSRAVEYKIDVFNKTAELLWQFIDNPTVYSSAMGDVQRLDDGNTLIGWGRGSTTVTEVTASNQKTFELTVLPDEWSYRAFKFNLGKSYLSAFIPKIIETVSINDVEVSDSLILIWTRNRLAQKFHLQIAEDSLFTKLVRNDSNLKDTSYLVNNLISGKKYYWHVLSYNNTDDIGGINAYSEINSFTLGYNTSSSLPETSENTTLFNNFPNPFSNSTIINYFIRESGLVNIAIYNTLGMKVNSLVNDYQDSGTHNIEFQRNSLSPGVYFCTLKSSGISQTIKLIIGL